jgi:hypothetical protein
MSDNDITSAAEKRRQKFMSRKQESGGSADALMKELKTRPWKLYFSSEGTIECLTQNEVEDVAPDWHTYDFPQEDLENLIDKDLRRYQVVQDTKDKNIFHVELKPIDTVKILSNDQFLQEVEFGDTEDFDIKCNIKGKKLTVEMSQRIKDEYEGVYPVSATRNGYRILRFYITKPGDPHIMYEYKNTGIADLLINDKVEFDLGIDLEHCGLYTNKIFDKYLRT